MTEQKRKQLYKPCTSEANEKCECVKPCQLKDVGICDGMLFVPKSAVMPKVEINKMSMVDMLNKEVEAKIAELEKQAKAEKEAKWEDQHRIVATELKCFVAENDPRPITEEDWQNEAVAKKFIVYDNEEGGVRIRSTESWLIANQVYARNTETLIKAISHIGEERLKKYYFGVGK